MSIAFLFPGQGAQHVGMGAELCRCIAVARDVFDQAEQVTGLPIKKLCFEGPQEELSRTDISQPAIFTVSMAMLGALDSLLPPDQVPTAAYCAGLSLGEYTALCAAGSMSFADALAVVAKRGQLMQDAAVAVPGGMVSLLGADEDVAAKVCRAARGEGVLVPANFNCPGQIVVSGTLDACRKAEEVAAECGASGAVPLDVAGAFHSPLMQPAADALAEVLAGVQVRPPRAGVLSNVTGQPHGRPEEIRRRLLDQLTSPIRWQRNCEFLLAEGVDTFLEIGPGRVLAGLMKRVERRASVTCINSLEAMETYTGVERPAHLL